MTLPRPARSPRAHAAHPARPLDPASDARSAISARSGRPPARALAVVVLALAGAVCALLPATLPAAGRPSAVVVPKVTRTVDLVAAYARIHAAGLRMAVPQAFSLRSLCLPSARTQSPAAGTRVVRGATVSVRRLTCYLGSPAGGYDRAVVVPDLRGATAASAVGWAERNQLYWELDRLPALPASGRPRLLDNYVVTDQQPPAGSLLARGTPCPGATGGCFVATPLVMRARRRR